MSQKIIELKAASTWMLFSTENMRSIEFERNTEPGWTGTFKIVVMYYGDEDDLVIDDKFTEAQCSEFRLKLVNSF